MPAIAVGTGAAVSKSLQRYEYALFLAAASGAATYPATKLGAATDPTGGWVRQGRLREDNITWSSTDMDFLDGRAGFNRSLLWTVPRTSEEIVFTIRLDEDDPDVQAWVHGTTATSLSSGSNSGQEYIYKSGTYYSAKVLIIGISPTAVGQRERHIYAGKSIVTFKHVHEDEYEGLDVTIRILDTSSTETFRVRDWA